MRESDGIDGLSEEAEALEDSLSAAAEMAELNEPKSGATGERRSG